MDCRCRPSASVRSRSRCSAQRQHQRVAFVFVAAVLGGIVMEKAARLRPAVAAECRSCSVAGQLNVAPASLLDRQPVDLRRTASGAFDSPRNTAVYDHLPHCPRPTCRTANVLDQCPAAGPTLFQFAPISSGFAIPSISSRFIGEIASCRACQLNARPPSHRSRSAAGAGTDVCWFRQRSGKVPAADRRRQHR